MKKIYLNEIISKQIEDYCKMNDIKDIKGFACRCASQGFAIVKFGMSPSDNMERQSKGIKDIKEENPVINRAIDKPSEKADKSHIEPLEVEKKVKVRKIPVIKKSKEKND